MRFCEKNAGTGKALGRASKSTIATFSIRNEAPIALIMIEMRGESRSGR